MFFFKNKINVYTLLLVISALTSACKKMVDIDPPNNTIGTQVVFNSNSNAATTLAGLYNAMVSNDESPSLTNGMMSIAGGLMADELLPATGATDVYAWQLYSNKALLQNVWGNTFFWGPTYKVIFNANAILEGEAMSTSKEFTDSARNQVRAEARLVRGFCYLYLYNMYGDVPLVLSTDALSNSTMSRTPVEQVKKQIEEDLVYAYQHLPTNYAVAGGEKVRPNSYSAATILARFYLYEKRWTEAADIASYVINSGKYSLQEPIKTFRANSSEAIWQLRLDVTDARLLTEWQYLTPTANLSSLTAADLEFFFTSMPDYVYMFLPKYMLTENMANSFESDDLRAASWTYQIHTPNVAPYNGIVYTLTTKQSQFDYSNPGVSLPTYYTVARLAELYLIRAEANAQLNNLSDAVNDINTIRIRAGLKGTTASGKENILNAIMQERRVEFFAEWGHRWFDLKRTNKAAEILGAIPEKQPWSNNSLLLFIPTEDIKSDPNLQQNPGYNY